jgi:hypoxanthine-DNA glycosylase
MRYVGFEAIADTDARVLILGTLPGAESHKRRQYYANPRNSFWWIMGKLFGASPDLPYEDRLNLLKKSGIALWDVCHSAERSGSSDSEILLHTVEPNDFATFFSHHPHIELICFNGQMSARIFRSKVLPLPANYSAIPREVLDSTSPAHTGLIWRGKLARWRQSLGSFVDSGHR